jgi:exosome complex component RRP43
MASNDVRLEAETFRKIHPLEFYRKFLTEKLRPDGRALSNVRKTHITTGSLQNTEGSGLVKMGNTSVICGIRGEVTVPKQKNPFSSDNTVLGNSGTAMQDDEDENNEESDRNEGIYVVGVELPSICAPQYQHWADSLQDTSTLQYHIQNTLEKYNVIDRRELCISAGEAVWVLYIDVYVLEHDGNLMDACFIAVLAALDNLRLPALEIVDSIVKVVENEPTTRLILRHFPIPLSFVILDQNLLIDPNGEEEVLSNGHFTIIFNEKGKLCAFYKPGGSPITSQDHLRECMAFAKQRAVEVHQLIREANALSRD